MNEILKREVRRKNNETTLHDGMRIYGSHFTFVYSVSGRVTTLTDTKRTELRILGLLLFKRGRMESVDVLFSKWPEHLNTLKYSWKKLSAEPNVVLCSFRPQNKHDLNRYSSHLTVDGISMIGTARSLAPNSMAAI